MNKIKKQVSVSFRICFIAIFSLLMLGSPVVAGNMAKGTDSAKEIHQNKITVTGVVLDKSNDDPLIGVTVVVKGTDIATMTDVDGRFTVIMPYAEASLVFSYIGFQPAEVKPAGKKEITVYMSEDAKALQEVVVVGYTKQRKETMIGSIATITTKDLKQSPTANINNALAGRLPGLIANQ